jgi:hydroxymethylbilane synthase
MASLLRLGTRGSKLALTQAGLVRDALRAAVPAFDAPDAIEIVAIRTTGDAIQDRPLAEAGGKGLFVKEIEEALLAGRIDAAVHSMKDMPTAQPAGLEIVNLRGNVDTRLAKREAGVVEATLLALAGLKRLGMAHVGTPVPEEEILPAVGQGAVCIECRADDARTRAWLAAIDHKPTATSVAAEHAMLAVLDGSCRTPIAGHAVLSGDSLRLRALIVKPDGSELLATERHGAASEAEAMGRDAGLELKRRGGPGFLST